jgi:hypothetical protein
MKKLHSLLLLLGCLSASVELAHAQPDPPRFVQPTAVARPGAVIPPNRVDPDAKRFDLDFPGGPPKAFVAALEKAMGKPMNVIIPEEYANVPIVPLKLRSVTLFQVFDAIGQAGTRTERYISGYSMSSRPTRGGMIENVRVPQYSQFQSRCGFRSADSPPTEGSIWYFYYDAPPPAPTPEPEPKPAKSFRCWQLGQTLESYSIDDITTAVETTWKMLGTEPLPKMSFHKETKLLIVVGTEVELSVVNTVLEQLSAHSNPTGTGGPRPRRLLDVPPPQPKPSATPAQP